MKSASMILIADSGSTKTDWICLDEGISLRFRTQGLNPYFTESTAIQSVLSEALAIKIPGIIPSRCYFYGSGCLAADRRTVVKKGLEAALPGAEITVETDLLGAARSLFGQKSGIAVILGTGSNTGYYDGKAITAGLPSLGYVLGDEGSGAHLGKILLKYYMEEALPVELQNKFEKEYRPDRAEILKAVYNQPFPNRYLASFAVFLSQNLEHPFVEELVTDAFTYFFDRYICRYSGYKKESIRATGAVAYYFRSALRKIAGQKKYRITKLTLSPLEGLAEFHKLSA
ncbi:MAG: hypothetical protein KJ607_03770 [Bacteroidetes bacterium]|nr:hypothetical protein [Bacteroidota bacterium]